MSKNDEFSVTVYVENQYSMPNKPDIIIRSPGKFKKIDVDEQNKKSKPFWLNITSSIVAAVIVIIVLYCFIQVNTSQKDNLMFIATVTN